MYKTEKTVIRIRETAKKNGIKISEMLLSCGLNINTLSSMGNRGSWIQANSLALIADYLEVSVDYLLGRTDNSELKQSNAIAVSEDISPKITISVDGIEYKVIPINKD